MVMNNSAPLEIISAPFSVYVAPVGTAFPEVGVEPAVDWVLLGTQGARNISADGITIEVPQTTALFRGLEGTGPVKMARTEEDCTMTFTLHDMSPEMIAIAMGVETPAAVTNGLAVDLFRGPFVKSWAVLARGPSSLMEDGFSHFEMVNAALDGSPSIQISKGEFMGLEFMFRALDTAAGFSRYVVQNMAPV